MAVLKKVDDLLLLLFGCKLIAWLLSRNQPYNEPMLERLIILEIERSVILNLHLNLTGSINEIIRYAKAKGTRHTRTILDRVLRPLITCRTLQTSLSRLLGASFNKDSDQKMLEELWSNLGVDTDQNRIPFKAPPCESWKLLGFQGNDPATDFRGAGILGLYQLINFSNSDIGRKIHQEAQYGAYWYPFASVGLNVTLWLAGILKSHPDLILKLQTKDLKIDEKISSSMFKVDRVQNMRSRRTRLTREKMADYELVKIISPLYALTMINFHTHWLAAKPENIFSFPKVFSSAQKSVTKFLRL